MKRLRVSYTLRELCAALDVSRSGYLAWKDRRPSARHLANAQLLNQMKTLHAHRHTRCYGSPRMTWELRANGCFVLGKPGRKTHAQEWPASEAPTSLSPKDNESGSRGRSFAQSAGWRRCCASSPSAFAQRHHLYSHCPRVALSGRRPGSIYPHGPWGGNSPTLCRAISSPPLWTKPSPAGQWPRGLYSIPIAAANTPLVNFENAWPGQICFKA